MESVSPSDDLVERLRSGDETAFVTLVDQLGATMLRVARMYVSTQADAQEVVQETWVGVLQGIDRFEGRSSLRTWIFRILANIAKTRGTRESRSVPFSALAGSDLDQPTWDPSSFRGLDRADPGHWSSVPTDWSSLPNDRLLGTEVVGVIRGAIDELPPLQAEVIRLRDVLGWTSEEVRNALDLSETNQRVLLHRARARVRQALTAYLTDTG